MNFMCYDLLFLLLWIPYEFPKSLSQTHHLVSPFDLCFKFFLPRLSSVEAKRRMNLIHCSLVKERRQSYFVALYDTIVMSSYLTSKEPVGKRIAPQHKLKWLSSKGKRVQYHAGKAKSKKLESQRAESGTTRLMVDGRSR